MDQAALNDKIQKLKEIQFPDGSKFAEDEVRRFHNAISQLIDWECCRINPVDFAERNAMDPDETIRLFIYGVKVGLFSFEWNLLCPLCGCREHSHETLNQLERDTYHCSLCDIDAEVDADQHLEVSFSVSKSIDNSSIDPYSSINEYWAYFCSPSIVWPKEIVEIFSRPPIRRLVTIPARKRTRIKFSVPPTQKYRISSLETHSVISIKFGEEGNPHRQSIDVIHTETGFDKKEGIVDGNSGEMTIANNFDRSIGCIFSANDSELLRKVAEITPIYFRPFVTGKMMLNNQHFRDLFLVDNLPDDLSLKINDITILFTDLKGSTELYDKTGDTNAYKLIKSHFKILQKIVHSYRGGIVKTMGDAIMASFNNPLDGVRASFSMLEEMEAFNKTVINTSNAIDLKIGLHRGNVIAVKANQTLDYFGQTVNIAARVQGLASSREIWLTNDIVRDEDAKSFMGSSGYLIQQKEVNLKGVNNLVKVYSCTMGQS